ncbi:hypothetical protein DDE18_16325 [Nocardioides gansuensis]|uniref:EfeO-type cupredoxin-like domain-containing protein n=1 Tax=Nocardioides gansuensis TaxID=2138300 RepID=A0A2T8F794_9ACTN|nr:hypothetical protein [Nocardioides gansuensis]PVG81575.1 hypothetical protein DDE18_16325 [Nocardioides gansuensis]
MGFWQRLHRGWGHVHVVTQEPSHMRITSVLVTLVLALGAAGCADEAGTPEGAATGTTGPTETTSESPSPTEGPGGAGQTIEITVAGDTVSPSGERVEVPLGEEVVLEVTADAPGELHVHSTPEQELAYEAGTTSFPLTFDQPGVVEVESHDLGLTIVQLEVR